jgi:Tfp pilus assembly protein PilF
MQSRFADAIKQFKLALKTNPSYVEAALNLASTLCDLSRYEEAAEAFQNAQKHLHPEWTIPMLTVGRLANQHAENAAIYAQAGLKDSAQQEYRKALSLFPRMPDVKLKLARLYLEEGIFDKAKNELEELIEISPDSTVAHNMLGLVYFKSGREDLAKGAWDRAAKLDPQDHASRVLMKASQVW